MPATTLPEIVPVFPLTGSLLLPGNLLPLNIFEPRYRNMVADALEGGQYIGMVQPLTPRQDNWVESAENGEDPDNPEIYRIGCLGRIEECEPQDDGRYLIILRGVSRFHIRRRCRARAATGGSGSTTRISSATSTSSTSSSTPRR